MTAAVCHTCSHPQVAEIDRLLLAGHTVLEIHKGFGLGYDSMKRHRRNGHVEGLDPARINTAGYHPKAGADGSPVGQLRDLLEQLQSIDQTTLSVTQRSQLAREMRLSLEALGKMAGPGTVAAPDLATSPDWLALQEALLRALQPFPEAREAVRLAIEQQLAQPTQEASSA